MRTRWQTMRARPAEDGLSLIEMIAAMMIFAMLVVGIGFALINILQMTKDSQSRETAISIASAELDAVRAIGDPFQVFDVPSRTETVGTNDYTVSRTAVWVTPDGDVDTCGAGGAPLQYKTVSVSVSWNGMRDGAQSVKTDTALVPTSRINDPSKGTILVSVKNEAGLGNGGVTLTATETTTLESIVTTPTNSDGCSFLLGVPPGEYAVKLTSSGHIDINQDKEPQIVKEVEAGSSAQFSFQYDQQGTYVMDYASNDLVGDAPKIPSNMDTTFFNANGRYYPSVSVSNLQGTVVLYPAASGYEVVAGHFIPASPSGTSCESVDPNAWADTTASPPVEGIRAPTTFTVPGGLADAVPIPMGVATVEGNPSYPYITAVSQPLTLLTGQPGCDEEMKYSFAGKFKQSNVKTKIALPFGTWKLYASNYSNTLGSEIDASKIELVTPGVQDGNAFALDPRGVTP